MVNINLAYTAPVNPDGASPILTRAQLWKGLERKVRKAPEFVPAITSCDVIKDTGKVVERKVYFKDGMGSDGEAVREVCQLFEPAKVDFHRDDGTTVSNTISEGKGGDSDLYMTYYFEWLHPDVTESDGAKIEELRKHHRGVGEMAVEKSIETIRRMVQDGTIE